MHPIPLIALLSALSTFALAQQDANEILMPRQPALSPDGTQVAFAWRGDVWIASSDGGAARRVTTHIGSDQAPVFHPDGKRLAFVSDRAGNDQVFVMELPSGRPVQVTHDSNQKRLVGFAAGGRDMVLVVSSDRHFHGSESRRVYLAPLSGEGSKRMLLDAGVVDAALSPDGSRLLFTRGRESWWRKGYVGAAAYQVWLAELGAEQHVLTRLSADRDGFQNVHEHSPMWTPDGMGFWFVSDPDGAFDLYHRDLQTGAVRRVTDVAAEDGSDDGIAFPTVAADGSLVVARRLFHLLRIDPTTGATRQLRYFAEGDASALVVERRIEEQTDAVAFTPDGKQMAFVAGEDVYLMDRVLKEPLRLTSTPNRESDLVFSKDGSTLYFVSDAAGEFDVYKVDCGRSDGIWWLPAEREIVQLTDDRAVESRLALSPDGSSFALLRDNQLWVMGLDGSGQRQVVQTWSAPSFDWSPDGRWICYATQDDDYNSDVWFCAVDGSRPPFNLSRHPGREGGPVWSPDGKRIAFVGQRDGEEPDIYYVNLVKEAEEETSRDRKLEEALAAMKKGASAKGGGKTASKTRWNTKLPSPAGDDEDDEGEDKDGGSEAEGDESVVVQVDFDGILDRIHRISIRDSMESGLIWSPDGKQLMFSATVENSRGIYTVSFPDVDKPKSVGKVGLSDAVWLADGKELVGIATAVSSSMGGGFRGFSLGRGGAPAAMSAGSGKIEKFEFSVREERDWSELRQLAFDQGWRAMRDRFYDPVMNHRDWDAVREKYRPAAARCLGRAEFNDLMNLMLGELNASHMGHSGGAEPLPKAQGGSTWSPQTMHLGLRFGPASDAGLLVDSVIPGGPCDQDRSRVSVGEHLLAVDGRQLDAGTDLDRLLTMPQARDVTLRVKGADGDEREVVVRPVASVGGLLYDEWVEAQRSQVEELSQGQLGYLHIRGMNMSSVRQMEEDLFAAGHDKDGLVIDVRYNGGGSTADHVLTILSQPVHAVTQSRGSGLGYPVDRKVYATWSKPIVLMCNEYSFSNAEILSHAVKQLGRGRVVGMRTGGGVISTGSVSLADGSRVRMPGRGWYLVTTGEDMELNGCLPDIPMWNPPIGEDQQLAAAVAALAEDVAAEKARGKAEPKPASSLRGPVDGAGSGR